MLKIIIVDDEPKVRKGVSALIKLYPEKYELAGCCATVEEVTEALVRDVPDVIITDIRMPGQDGLEMIGYLKHRYQNLEFVVLSGYNEFDYARKALQLQVFDFLLKPLKQEDLYRVLDAIAAKRMEDRVGKAESAADNCFFNLVRSENLTDEQKNLKKLGLLGQEGRYRAAVLDVRTECDEFVKTHGNLKYALKNKLPEFTNLYMCFGYQLILILEKEYTKKELEKYISRLEKEFHTAFYFGVSTEKKSYDDLKKAYFEALDAAKQYIYDPEQKVTIAENSDGQEGIVFSGSLCKQLMDAVRSGNHVLMKITLEEFLDPYRKNRCGIRCLKRHLMFLKEHMELVSEEIGVDRTYCTEVQNFLRNIEEVGSFTEIEDFIYQRLSSMTGEAESVVQWKMNSYYIKQILSFIQENYGKAISLEDVAAHVNLSGGYLSDYFKTQMGMSFTNYLLQVRMEKAKELLTNTNEKIYRIAEITGYQNSQYFVTVFKKYTGVTPVEYRKFTSK